MKFEDITMLLERKQYTHRQGYTGNEKGSYIKKGKTYWDYTGGATPGNERIVTQIQSKIVHKFGSYASREKIKKFLKGENSQKIYDRLKKVANSKFGSNEENPEWRAYVYGGFTTIAARSLSGKNKGSEYLLWN